MHIRALTPGSCLGPCLAGLVGGLMLSLGSAAQADDRCAPQDGMTFVCGPVNAEDLVWVPSTNWILTSGMSDEGDGHLYLLDPKNQSYEELYPASSPQHDWDRSAFAACPGELSPENFSAHGLSIITLHDGLHRLYVTGHGAREAVEIFEIDSRGAKPEATWVGCIPMPEHDSINSVAALSDGGFITTRISGHETEARDSIFAGEISGFLYEWHPGGALNRSPGTDMSGPNGIVVSEDGQTVFVGSWGRSELVRFVRDEVGSLQHDRTVELNFRADNVRWTDEGTLLVAGHRLSASQDCDAPLCFDAWEAAEIDPQTMAVTTLVTRRPIPGFTGATVAIADGKGLWFGTFHGDRIVYIPEEKLSGQRPRS